MDTKIGMLNTTYRIWVSFTNAPRQAEAHLTSPALTCPQSNARARVSHKFNSCILKCCPYLFDRIEVRADRALFAFQPPNGRNRYSGLAGKFELRPSHKSSCCLYLLRDHQHFPLLYVLARERKLQTINESF
jgi:hypothetical protein